jgi:hypothetical protein
VFINAPIGWLISWVQKCILTSGSMSTQRDEWVSGLTSWRKALKIPDSDVVIEGRCAKVADLLNQDKAYVVWNPGSQFGICNCSWAEMHMLKVINICGNKGVHVLTTITIKCLKK